MSSNIQLFIEKQEGLKANQIQSLTEIFSNLFEKTDTWKNEIQDNTPTSYDDGEKIMRSRELRLQVREARLTITKLHKELKADALAEGRALDAIKRFGLEILEPLEDQAEKNENFIKIQEELRLSKLQEERMKIIGEYADVMPVHQTDWSVYSETDFLQQVKVAKALRLQAEQERKDEEEAMKAQAEEAERERQAKEAELQKAKDLLAKQEAEADALRQQLKDAEDREASITASLKIAEQKEEPQSVPNLTKRENPDKDLLIDWIKKVAEIPVPECKTKRGKEIQAIFQDAHLRMVKFLQKTIEDAQGK